MISLLMYLSQGIKTPNLVHLPEAKFPGKCHLLSFPKNVPVGEESAFCKDNKRGYKGFFRNLLSRNREDKRNIKG